MLLGAGSQSRGEAVTQNIGTEIREIRHIAENGLPQLDEFGGQILY